MNAQIVRTENHLVNLLPGTGIIHLSHSWQTVLLQFGSDTCTIVLCVPYIVVFRHTNQVTPYIDIVIGPDLRLLGQGIAVQLETQRTSCTGICQALNAVVLDIKNQIAGDVHIQLGINHRYLTLSKPVVQFPEHLTMDGVLILYHRTFLDIWDGKLRLVIMLVNLRRDNVAFLQGGLHYLATLHIKGSSLDALHALIAIGIRDTVCHRYAFTLEIGIGAATWLGEAHTIRFQTSDIITS